MKRIIVSLLLCFCGLVSYAQKIHDPFKEWNWHYYVQTGWQWSGHGGVDAAIHCIIHDRWFIGGRLWINDYSTKQYPKLESMGLITGYPYSHEEFALQTGWFHQLNKQWFLTLDAGPSYVRYFYPVGLDSLADDKHISHYMYKREEKTAMGWAFSGSINWHQDWIGASLSPQYFLNRPHPYSGITISLFIYNKGDY